MLKTVLIAAGTSFVLFSNFLLYCCLRVASDADDRMEQMMQTHEHCTGLQREE